ncbi:CDP-diacylglycerol diphosphatase [Cupriavidus pauculus]|uniref:CDP-diacylglycerol pyrophosphatase n=1 Tax=Cupriavidus pauculus TaxID=82633 RepID=A0A3G8H6A9_9BURK|nr:CDP-diacylglycerol diphosphatase [Cupriavidus pauculus]AZG15928.1 CDP-diacylglycerol diphosphatase [Cupriavidus pauculus]
MKRWLLYALALAASGPAFADAGLLERLVGGFSRDSLWKNVQQRCLVPPSPAHADCVIVDRAQGFVLYKDMIGASHYLVIPDHAMAGVDDPRVWQDGPRNAWSFGWQARDIVGKAVGRPLPDTLLGLAINARTSRSQDQLHIHLDCISDRAREFLLNGNIGTQWQDLSFNGKPMRAMLVPAEPAALPVNPFSLVRQDVLGKAADGTIADRGVFVAYVKPAAGPAGFVVVDEPVDKARGSNGHASDFLDRGCKLGRADPTDR